jgi:hypothetical protein
MGSLTSPLAGLSLSSVQASGPEGLQADDAADQQGALGQSAGSAEAEAEEQREEKDSRPDLRIQLVSDLHIEMRRPPKIPVNAPCIALLGDIGVAGTKMYAAFVRSLSEKFETVLILAGNHEFYGGEYEERKYDMRRLADSLPNVRFLDCESVNLGGVKVLGCTLWSHVPPPAREVVRNTLTDYRVIEVLDIGAEEPRPLLVSDTNAMHRREATFLWKEIAAAKEAGQTLLVLTHHSSLIRGTSHPEYEGLPTNHGFSADLSELMGSPVAAWVYGHTHFNPSELVVNGTRVLANQKGYSEEKTGVAFDPGLVLHVKGEMETGIETRNSKKS